MERDTSLGFVGLVGWGWVGHARTNNYIYIFNKYIIKIYIIRTYVIRAPLPAVVLDAGGEGLEAEDARARVEEVPHVIEVVERHQVRPQNALCWLVDRLCGFAGEETPRDEAAETAIEFESRVCISQSRKRRT